MKELTIEEKAKAYDEALERIRKELQKCGYTGCDTARFINRYFPELKESEGERIRKELLEHCKNQAKPYIQTGNKCPQIQSWIDWLEKQGSEPNWYHHKVDLSDCSEEYRKAYYDGWNNCNMQHSQYKSESNDVVKCLINGMKFYYEDNEEATWGTEKFSMKVKDILSWLEKQGKQKPTLPKWKYKNDNTPLLRDSLILNKYGCVAKSPSGAFVNDVWVIDYDELVKLPKEELEKQGEQETLCDKCRKEHPSHSCQDITELGRCFVEHEQETDNSYCQENCKGFQETGKCFCDGECKDKKEYIKQKGEQKQDVNVQINPSEYVNDMGGNGCYLKNTTQTSTWSKKEEKVDNQNCVKSADDIKPKFKVGDWICNDMCDAHIASIEDGMYYFDEGDGLSIVFVDERYHLWTIKDAMDGDVLHSTGFHSDCIFIFNGLDNWKFDEPDGERAVATGYCCLTLSADNMEFGIQGPDCIKVDTVKPATKIQRDLLFQKMKEAGYDFDFETKELKKIENDLTEFENALADVCRGWIGEELGWKDYIIKNSLPLLEFAKKQFDEYEQKSVWSEEDERRLNFCLNILRPKTLFGSTEITNIDTINTKWLKSLKDRIQPHKQWKPSEEQIKAFEHFVRSIGESGYASLYENNTKLLYSLLEQLKKL